MSSKEYEFNQDELETPKWLNKEFIVKVLENCDGKQNITIVDLEFSPGTAKNDHYASIMFRVKVNYLCSEQLKKRSLIVKTMPQVDGTKMDLLKESYVFETEVSIYKKVMPKFIEILREAGDHTTFGPKCLYYELNPNKVLVFEDLVPLGYIVLRNRFANIEEVRLAFSKLAKWHAVGYKMNLEQPEFFTEYQYGLFNTPTIKENASFADGIKNFIEMLDNHSDLIKYKPYFMPLKDKILDRCEQICSEYRGAPNSSAFYVLCHGDFHTKNMMFQHNMETDTINDILFLDYQLSNITSISYDVLYAVYLLLDENMRAKNLDELIYFYCITFQETLKKIDFQKPIPKIMQLRHEIMRPKEYNIFLLTTFLPMWLYVAKGKCNIGDTLSSADARKLFYKESYYVDEVRRLLPKFLHLGYLEY